MCIALHLLKDVGAEAQVNRHAVPPALCTAQHHAYHQLAGTQDAHADVQAAVRATGPCITACFSGWSQLCQRGCTRGALLPPVPLASEHLLLEQATACKSILSHSLRSAGGNLSRKDLHHHLLQRAVSARSAKLHEKVPSLTCPSTRRAPRLTASQVSCCPLLRKLSRVSELCRI